MKSIQNLSTPIWLLENNSIKKEVDSYLFYADEYNEFGHDYIDGEYVYGDDCYVGEDYMDERWWYIDGYPGYMISDRGRIWSSKTQKFLKPKPMDGHGHLGVCLRINGVAHYEYIHRLMAKAFIPNPKNYPIVRHLNDIPNDNYLDNFSWGTQKHNFEDSLRNGNVHFVTPEERELGLSKMRKPIIATNIRTGERKKINGQTEASKFLGIPQSNIWKVMNGERSHAGGYYFEYLKDGDENETD